MSFPSLLLIFWLLPITLCSWDWYTFPSADVQFFDGVSHEFIDVWDNFTLNWLDPAIEQSRMLNYYISLPFSLIIAVHLLILTRKSMATSSTNIRMAAISMCDLIYLLNLFVKYLNYRYQQTIIENNMYSWRNCIPPLIYQLELFKWVWSSVAEYLNRCQSWLAVILAAVRSSVIRSTSEPRSNTLTSPVFGWKITTLTLILCLPVPVLTHFSHFLYDVYVWESGAECPENVTRTTYTLTLNPDYFVSQNTLAVADSWLFQFVPSLLVCHYTLRLIVEIRRASRRSRELGVEGVRSTRISLLVLCIAVSFVLVKIPQACVTILTALTENRLGFYQWFYQMSHFITLLTAGCSVVHFLICLALSSQYRQTGGNLFFCHRLTARRAPPATVVPVSKSQPT